MRPGCSRVCVAANGWDGAVDVALSRLGSTDLPGEKLKLFNPAVEPGQLAALLGLIVECGKGMV